MLYVILGVISVAQFNLSLFLLQLDQSYQIRLYSESGSLFYVL